MTTKGTTNPKNKYYPATLSPWEDFPRARDDMFSRVRALYHPSEEPALRAFQPLLALEWLGRENCHIRLASEAGLRVYEKLALEVHTTAIVRHLAAMDAQAQEQLGLDLGQGLTFENNPNSLDDTAEEVQERLQIQPPQTPPRRSASPDLSELNLGSDQSYSSIRTRADQYGVYQNVEDTKRRLLFVVEYKPPHKLSAGSLRSGFRPMDVCEEVIERTTIPPPIPTDDRPASSAAAARPTNESRRQKQAREQKEAKAAEEKQAAIEARLQYNADKLVVAVATQTFHYMIENGLEYSYITTGESFVFLHIREDDPTTLYYHVTVPSDEIDDNEVDSSLTASHTAVAQATSFCLMTFLSEPRNQEWRIKAKNQLRQHPVSYYNTVLLETPKSERILARRRKLPKSPLYQGVRKGGLTSDYHLRSRVHRRDPDDDQGDDHANQAGSSAGPSRPTAPTASSETNRQNDGRANSQPLHDGQQRRYCTQQCLLGITRSLPIDSKCPNAASHPRGKGKRHAISQAEFLQLLQQQLAANLDNDFEPLGLQGARGALFKVTLASHGYTFVGKGTVYAFVPDLKHEARIYQHLEPLQGTAVPVCLGEIKLLEHYCLDLRVMILRLLVMSWGGEDMARSATSVPDLAAHTRRTVSEVRAAGIDQCDVRSPNLLWNEEAQRIMLIDFERAARIQVPSPSSPRKRAVMQEKSVNERPLEDERAANKKRKALPTRESKR